MFNFQFPNIRNRKLITGSVILLGLVALSLGFKPWQGVIGPPTQPTPTPGGATKKRASDPQGLGFDSLVSEKQPTIIASASQELPDTLATYEINPAPYQLFSPSAAQVLAAHFGFTASAKASRSGSLIIYREKDKALTLDTQVGTVSFTSDLGQLQSVQSPGTEISAQQAAQKVTDFLKTASLSSQFINWASGEVKNMGLSQGAPKETGLKEELRFYQITPTISLNNYQLLLPQPLYAQVSLSGEVVGLYTWFVNLDGENPKPETLKDFKTARRAVEGGQGVVFSTTPDTTHFNLDQVELAYFAPPNFFVDFSQRHLLKIVYVFYDEKGNQIYINAVKE